MVILFRWQVSGGAVLLSNAPVCGLERTVSFLNFTLEFFQKPRRNLHTTLLKTD